MKIHGDVLMTAAIASLSLASTTYAQAPTGPCKQVFDAMLKVTSTPHHTVTVSNGGQPGETIATADAMYVKVGAQWRKSPMTPQAMLAQQQDNIRNTTMASCSPLPDEMVDGKAAAVYQTHYEQKDLGATEAKVWIAKATGLPLRTDVALQAGDKTSVSTRFDYEHITTPIVK